MQKVMIRGLARDDKTLRQLGVASGAKVMVVGSTLTDVLSVAKPDTKVSERGGGGGRLILCPSGLHVSPFVGRWEVVENYGPHGPC